MKLACKYEFAVCLIVTHMKILNELWCALHGRSRWMPAITTMELHVENTARASGPESPRTHIYDMPWIWVSVCGRETSSMRTYNSNKIYKYGISLPARLRARSSVCPHVCACWFCFDRYTEKFHVRHKTYRFPLFHSKTVCPYNHNSPFQLYSCILCVALWNCIRFYCLAFIARTNAKTRKPMQSAMRWHRIEFLIFMLKREPNEWHWTGKKNWQHRQHTTQRLWWSLWWWRWWWWWRRR